MENEFIHDHPFIGQLCKHKKCDMGIGIALVCRYIGLNFVHNLPSGESLGMVVPPKASPLPRQRNLKKAFRVFWFKNPDCDSFICEDYLVFKTGQNLSSYKKYSQTDIICPPFSSKKEKKL